jgi:two-component system, chemotaxis family, protein-glutamate methylesterase/glutaminase
MRSPSLRVLVVDDSLTVRKAIVDILDASPDLEVVGEAADGRTAIELCDRLRPDVITMDMMLPVMTGLAATEYIMAFVPTPILIVSASTNRGELFKTYDALAAGAVDVLEKPLDGAADAEWSERLMSAIRMVARIRVVSHPRARLGALGRNSPSAGAPADAVEARGLPPRVLAIGASTGGPGAVLTILRELPPDFAVPILLVIHVAEPFGTAMAEWLDAQTRFTVRHPHDGEPIPELGSGLVLMAVPDRHLLLSDGRVTLGDGPERASCRPSVDVLFESLAASEKLATIACLLTGMGKDGATGMQALRRAGGYTIAQDEASSVVFGMPGEAVRIGAAREVLPLERIAPRLATLCGCASRRTEPR